MNERETYAIQLQGADDDWVNVGTLRRSENRNWFETLPTYWSRPSRPILGQVFEERGPNWTPNAHVGLPRWFSHLLPEGQLRQAVAIASGIKSERELQLLALLGSSDLPGALRVVAADDDGQAIPPSDSDAIDEVVNAASPVLKFSLAGLQMKFSVRESGRGLTIPLSGEAGNFILKTPDQRPNHAAVPESEFALMQLARLSGIAIPSIRLIKASEVAGIGKWSEVAGNSLLVERYDRRGSEGRVHAEELAQVMDIPTGRSAEAKYRTANFETVANFVANLVGVEAVKEVIDRIVLNVLSGNGDAHLKNWSFIYPDGLHPTLSPAYDLVPTVLFVPRDDLGLNLNRSKTFSDITLSSFRALGERSGYGAKRAEITAADAVERVMSNWGSLRQTLSHSQLEVLNAHRSSLQLVKS